MCVLTSVYAGSRTSAFCQPLPCSATTFASFAPSLAYTGNSKKPARNAFVSVKDCCTVYASVGLFSSLCFAPVPVHAPRPIPGAIVRIVDHAIDHRDHMLRYLNDQAPGR